MNKIEDMTLYPQSDVIHEKRHIPKQWLRDTASYTRDTLMLGDYELDSYDLDRKGSRGSLEHIYAELLIFQDFHSSPGGQKCDSKRRCGKVRRCRRVCVCECVSVERKESGSSHPSAGCFLAFG